MDEITNVTQEGLDKMRAELIEMKTKGRSEMAKAIAEARDKGDLKENAEYDAAKEAQGLLELKISKLENLIANARLIDESQFDDSKVFILANVKVKNLANNAIITYKLVSEKEANLKEFKISVDSPVGKGLLGKAVGEIAEIKVPAGSMRLEVLEITR
jgi:transcription elongation factor GreA